MASKITYKLNSLYFPVKGTNFSCNYRDYLICLPHNELPVIVHEDDINIQIHYSHETSSGEGRYNTEIYMMYKHENIFTLKKVFSSRFPTYDDAVVGCEMFINRHYHILPQL